MRPNYFKPILNRLFLVSIILLTGFNLFSQTILEEDFENSGSIPTGWVNEATNGYDWKFNTSVSSTGGSVSADHTSGTGYFTYFDSWSASTGKVGQITSPTMDLSSYANVELNFFWNRPSSGYTSRLKVNVYANGTWNNDIYAGLDGQTSGWEEISLSLNSYLYSDTKIQFEVESDWYRNIFLDDVSVYVPSNDPKIDFDLSEVDFGVKNINSNNSIDLTITNNGVNDLVITGATVNSPFSCTYSGIITSGNSATATINYDPTSVGTSSETLTFNISSTFLGTNTIDLSGIAIPADLVYQGFEDATFPPSGWSADAEWARETSTYYEGSAGARLFKLGVYSDSKLETPKLTVDASDYMVFYAKTSSTINTIQLQYSSDQSTWNNIGDLITLTADWELYAIDLSSLSGNDYYFAFNGNTTSSYTWVSNYIYIDSILHPSKYVPTTPTIAYGQTTYDVGGKPLGDSYDSGDVYYITNDGGGTLSITSATDLSSTDFSTNFNDAVALENQDTAWFGFTYTPSSEGSDNETFTIETNDVSVVFTLSGEAYILPDDIVEVGTGTEIETELPTEPYNNYTYSQSIYLQSEIDTTNQRITSIYYHYNGNTAWTRSVDVYLGHTTKTEFTSTTDWVNSGDLTLVFSGDLTVSASDEWIEIPLTEYFSYNNTENLVVAFDDNAGSWNSSGDEFFGHSTANNSSLINTSWFNSNVDPASPPTGAMKAKRANIRFEVENQPTTPVFSANPKLVDFGNVNLNLTSDAQTFTIRNSGIGSLILNSATIEGTDAAEFDLTDGNTYPETITTGNITVDVTFTPTTTGSKTATLKFIEDSSGYLVDRTIELSGAGFDPTIYTLPYTQNFDEVTVPNLPLDWTTLINSSSSYAEISVESNFSAPSSPNNAILYNDSDNSGNIILVSPPVDGDISNTKISFYVYGFNYPILVGTMTNPSDESTFVEVENITATSTFTEHTVEFIGDYSGIQYVAFKHGLGGTYRTVKFDSFNWESIPETANAVLNATKMDAGLVEMGENISTGDVITLTNTGLENLTITSTSFTASDFTSTINESIALGYNESHTFGLEFTANTLGIETGIYEIVTNGGTVSIDLQAVVYAQTDIVEDFEDAVPPTDPLEWTNNAIIGANTWSQSASQYVEGSKSAYYASAFAASGNAAELITPRLDLTLNADNIFAFYYLHPTTTGNDSLILSISEDGGSNWVVLDEIKVMNEIWNTFAYDLSAYSSDNVYFKFYAVCGDDGIRADQFIDYAIMPPFYTDEVPATTSLIEPADAETGLMSSVNLNWETVDFASGYKMYLGESSTTPDISEYIDLGNETEYTATGLNYGTTYYWQIVPYNHVGNASGAALWSFSTKADPTISNWEYSQNFDAITTPELPEDWSKIVETSSTGYVQTGTSTVSSSPNSISIYNAGDSEAELFLVSPPVSTDVSNTSVSFKASGGATMKLQVGTISNPLDYESFILIDELIVPYGFAEYVVDFNSDYAGIKHIAFKHGNTGTYQTINIDDVVWDTIPQYTVPTISMDEYKAGAILTSENLKSETFEITNLGIENLTINDVTISNAVFSSSISDFGSISLGYKETYEFDITYSPSAAVVSNETLTIETNNGNLVVDLIGAGYEANYYTEGFEGSFLPANWTSNIVDGTADWLRSSAQASSGTYAASYNTVVTSAGNSAELISPQLDLSHTSNHILGFKMYHAETEQNDILNVYATKDNGSNWSLLEAISYSGDNWENFVYDLSSYLTDEVQIKFEFVSDVGTAIYLDEVILPPVYSSDVPSATSLNYPTDNETDVDANILFDNNISLSTSVEISWGSIFEATGYKLYVGESSTTPDISEYMDLGNVTTYTFDGISLGTTYYWQVVPYNFNGDATVSDIWSFTTESDPTIMPGTEETFASYPVTNWTEAKGVLAEITEFTASTSSWDSDDFANDVANGKAVGMSVWTTEQFEWMITPPINLGDGTNDYQIDFDLALTEWFTTTEGVLAADDKFKVVISTDGSWSSLNTLRSFENGNDISNSGTHVSVDLSDHSGIVKVGFYVESTVASSGVDIFIDQFEINDKTDLTVANLAGIDSDCEHTSTESLTATISNTGVTTIANGETIDLHLQVNDGGTVTESYTLTSDLIPAASFDYSFAQTIDMVEVDSYEVKVTVDYTYDADPDNDQQSETLHTYGYPNGGTAEASPADVCINTNTIINVTGFTEGSDIQWQSSLNFAGPYDDVSAGTGMTTDSYTTFDLSENTFFRAKITNYMCTSYSSQVSTTVHIAPTVEVSTSEASCGIDDGTATLTPSGGNGAYAYSWNTSPEQTSATATGLYGGIYEATVTDDYCEVNINNIVVNESGAPTVTASEDVSICQGSAANLSVTGTADSYEWTPADGLNTDIGTAVIASPETTATYTVTGTKDGCSGFDQVEVTVTPNTAILSQPSNKVVCIGTEANFDILADGTGTLLYQWFFNDEMISGATSSSYTIVVAEEVNAGNYKCEVTSDCGDAIMSNEVTLTVNPEITISNHPEDMFACLGEEVGFSVIATGTNVEYQWMKGAVTLGGETSSELVINSLSASNAGDYHCVLTSECSDPVNSEVATLSIYAETEIVTDPENQVICLGDEVEFTVEALGENLTYQWKKDDVDIESANSYTYTILETSIEDEAEYKCEVIGECGTIESIAATLTLNPITEIITQPLDMAICIGTDFELTIEATGTGNLEYQWQLNGVDIEDATNDTLLVLNASAANEGDYTCLVTGDCGEITSEIANVLVNILSSIITNPVNDTICEGETTDLSIVAEGTDLTYQWYFNNEKIENETIADLSISNTTLENAGDYFCVVYSSCSDSIISESATIVINEATQVTVNHETLALCKGESFTLEAAATGYGEYTYQWYKDNLEIEGETESSYYERFATTSSTGKYFVEVAGGCNTITSDTIEISVENALAIKEQPIDVEVCIGEDVEFEVIAEGEELSYIWKANNSIIDGAVTNNLIMPNIQETGIIKIVCEISATGSCGGIIASDTVLCEVHENPVIDLGDDVAIDADSYTIDAGEGFASYLWNTGDITQTIDVTEDGEYSIIVANEFGCEAFDTIYVDLTTGILTNESNASVKVYPNPMTDYTKIDFGANYDQVEMIRLVDVTGKLSAEYKVESESIIIENDLDKGAYFIQVIYRESGMQVIKLIVE